MPKSPAPELGPLTVEDFLIFERRSSRRHEFVAGRVYALSDTTTRHNRIVSNVHVRLRAAAAGTTCAAYVIDLKVLVARDRVYYPDGVVVCEPHDGETLLFENPCLIVEVTSPATRRLDRGEKLDAYLATPSLRGYLIAEHDRRHVTLYSRSGGGAWHREELVGTGTVNLPCLGAVLSLDDVYDGVELPPLRVREEDPLPASEWAGHVEHPV